MSNYFGKNLKHIRERENISQQEIAKEIKVDRSTISRWETGEMEATVDKVIQVAETINIPVEYLLKKDLTIFDIDGIFDITLGVSYDDAYKKQKIRDELNDINISNNNIDTNNKSNIINELLKNIMKLNEDDLAKINEIVKIYIKDEVNKKVNT